MFTSFYRLKSFNQKTRAILEHSSGVSCILKECLQSAVARCTRFLFCSALFLLICIHSGAPCLPSSSHGEAKVGYCLAAHTHQTSQVQTSHTWLPTQLNVFEQHWRVGNVRSTSLRSYTSYQCQRKASQAPMQMSISVNKNDGLIFQGSIQY